MARFSATDAFGSAFSILYRNLPVYLGTQGVFILAGAVVLLALELAGQSVFGALDPTLFEEDPLAVLPLVAPLIVFAIFAGILAAVFAFLASGLGIVVTHEILEGRRPNLAQAWDLFRPRLLNYLGTSILIASVLLGVVLAAVAVGGLLAFVVATSGNPVLSAVAALLIVAVVFVTVVAVVFLALHWAVATPVSILEGRRVTENLHASGEYTRGARGAVFLTLLLSALVAGGLAIAASIPFAVAQGAAGLASPEADLGAGFALFEWATTTVVDLAVGFLGAAVVVVVYRRLREPGEAPPVVPSPEPAPPAPPMEPGGG